MDDIVDFVIVVGCIALVGMFVYLLQPQHIKNKSIYNDMIKNEQCEKTGSAFVGEKELGVYNCEGKVIIL